MTNYTRNMPQTATYWAVASRNAFNEPTFAAPVQIKCRWEDKVVLFRDAAGRERVSTAVVYPNQPLALEGYLFLGTSASTTPRALSGAHEILQVGASPNISGTLTLNKAYL